MGWNLVVNRFEYHSRNWLHPINVLTNKIMKRQKQERERQMVWRQSKDDVCVYVSRLWRGQSWWLQYCQYRISFCKFTQTFANKIAGAGVSKPTAAAEICPQATEQTFLYLEEIHKMQHVGCIDGEGLDSPGLSYCERSWSILPELYLLPRSHQKYFELLFPLKV